MSSPIVTGCTEPIFTLLDCPNLPPVYYSLQITAECPSGSEGGPFISPSGKFKSLISQEDADNQANDYIYSLLSTQCTGDIPIVQSNDEFVNVSTPFFYQIVANNNPDSYGAIGLPLGLSVDTVTGIISGTITSTIPQTYTVDISATNSFGTGDGTLNIHVQVPSSVSVTFSNQSNSGITQVFEVSVDGASYVSGSFGTTYHPTTQIKYRLTLVPGIYSLFGGASVIKAEFQKIGSPSFLSGSSSSVNGNMTTDAPDHNSFALYIPLFGNNNFFDAPYYDGIFNVTQSVSGSVVNFGDYYMGVAYHAGGTLVVTNTFLETILNF